MEKNRIPISQDIVAEVLFVSDRTCCVCNERGKTIQIHHVDEDPSNNNLENLSVLCLECHNDTQIKGGFGRKLSRVLVVKYRDEWQERVKKRRDDADRLAISKISGVDLSVITSVEEMSPIDPSLYTDERSNKILEYVNSLPDSKQELKAKAQPEWDTGVRTRMVNATYGYIDSLQGILVAMAGFYPPNTFGEDPHKFFSEQISLRFAWHRSYVEPDGHGTGGTILYITVGSSVMEDVEKMVEDMAQGLVGYDDRFDWRNWPDKWRK